MKNEYTSPECRLICLASSHPLAVIADFDDLQQGGGWGESTVVSDGDIEIDIG